MGTQLILRTLLVLERVGDLGDSPAHLVHVLGAVGLRGAAGEDRAGFHHHFDMVLVGGAPRRGDRGAASAPLQITERLQEGSIDQRHVLGTLGCLNRPGRCLLNDSHTNNSAEKRQTRHGSLRHNRTEAQQSRLASVTDAHACRRSSGLLLAPTYWPTKARKATVASISSGPSGAPCRTISTQTSITRKLR